ncbi:NUDIX hydrolase [Kitasatospora sp. A2-31]|uniref:NUDIX hydrolase n=1 Tax=Kitasatospora sp. A2-31 TaxID=2916414 RepID=UPI001EED5D91|nr:NUDIX domain-containing protein [Kitasatospora sp. A2-31]MCG6499751.1 NUDIX domain-containing protein [Kitasatospora sp. A2-31]
MREPLAPPTRSEVLDVRDLVLVEAPPLRLSAEERAARDRVWDEAVRRNPALFDGPVVACTGVSWDGPGRLVVSWTRATYRHYALRNVPGTTVPTASLSVSVLQPTSDRRLLVGRMSPATATPGRWQPPGGSVEPRPDGRPLDTADLHREAARELAEETGIRAAPEELRLWAVTRGPYGSIGVLFLAPALPRALVCERFAALPPERELVEIAFVGSPAELARLAGPRAEYLGAALHRYAAR